MGWWVGTCVPPSKAAARWRAEVDGCSVQSFNRTSFLSSRNAYLQASPSRFVRRYTPMTSELRVTSDERARRGKGSSSGTARAP